MMCCSRRVITVIMEFLPSPGLVVVQIGWRLHGGRVYAQIYARPKPREEISGTKDNAHTEIQAGKNEQEKKSCTQRLGV